MALPTYAADPPRGESADSPTVKRVRLPSGVTLEYAEQGKPNGTPAIFLHGLSDSWRSFERLFSYLPDSIHAFALSQRGHGNSDRPDDYSIRRMAGDVAEFMDSLDIRNAVIVGHSMGSMVAEQFALDHAGRAKALVLLSATSSMVGNGPLTELAEALETVDDPIPYELAREFQESTLAQPIPADFLETVIAECRKAPVRVWRSANAEILKFDLTADLAAVNVPTVIVHGDQDTFMTRAFHEVVNRAIRGSRFCIYEGAGHAMHWEEPSRVAADLVAFVERLSAKPLKA